MEKIKLGYISESELCMYTGPNRYIMYLKFIIFKFNATGKHLNFILCRGYMDGMAYAASYFLTIMRGCRLLFSLHHFTINKPIVTA